MGPFRSALRHRREDPTEATSAGMERTVEFGEMAIGLGVGCAVGMFAGSALADNWQAIFAGAGALSGLFLVMWWQNRGAERRARQQHVLRQQQSQAANDTFETRLAEAKKRGDLDRFTKANE